MSGADAAALSGLQAAQNQMTAIGNNVSNGSTIGYKRQEAAFSSIVAGTANPNSFASGGVQAVPESFVSEQGLLETTSSPTDLAISGNGFFVVGQYATLATGATNSFSFTRAGSFQTDAQGYLKNTAGYYLQGWATDSSGNPITTNLNSLNELQTVSINSIAGISSPTSTISLGVNLPQSDAINATEVTSMEVYDSLGVPHTLTFTWTRTASNPITWDLAITSPDGTVTQNTATGAAYSAMPIVFNGSGQPLSYNGGTTPPNIYVQWTDSANNSTINLNLGTVGTSTGISSRYGPYSETMVNQDGNGVGQLSGIDINSDGLVSAMFNNGQTLNIFKIPLANFAAPQLLSALNGNVWQQTNLSGNPLLAAANSAGMGSIFSNALEQSTVQLANEFTNMMEVQRYYTGNIKVIQTSQAMFDDLKQL